MGRKRGLKLFFAGLGIVLGCKTASPPASVSQIRLKQAIHDAAVALQKMIKSDGEFTYRVSLNSGILLPRDYNILRHAGAIYSLGQYYQRFPDEALKRNIIQTTRFLLKQIRHTDSGADYVMDPDVKDHAKLGASGLGLVALCKTRELFPEAVALGDMRRLGKFLLSMQTPEGHFFSSFTPGTGPSDQHYVLYYPGEAILGLLMLYGQDPSREWRDAAIRGLEWLAKHRKSANKWDPDNWSLVATRYLFDLKARDPAIEFDSKLLQSHLLGTVKADLEGEIVDPQSPLLGATEATGDTTKVAVRMEGYLAALDIFPADEVALRARVEAAVFDGLNFLMRSQIQAGEWKGAIPDTYLRDQNNVLSGSHELRIDYIQHALSSFLKASR